MVSICSWFTCIWHWSLFSPFWNFLFPSLRFGFFDLPLSCSVWQLLPNLLVASSSSSTSVFLKFLSWASSPSHSSHAVFAISFLSHHAEIYISAQPYSLLISVATNLFIYWVFLSEQPYLNCSSFTPQFTCLLIFQINWKAWSFFLGWPLNLSSKPGQFWEKGLHQ